MLNVIITYLLGPEFAIDNTPLQSCLRMKFSSPNLLPYIDRPPLPSPAVMSPACITKPGTMPSTRPFNIRGKTVCAATQSYGASWCAYIRIHSRRCREHESFRPSSERRLSPAAEAILGTLNAGFLKNRIIGLLQTPCDRLSHRRRRRRGKPWV